MHAQGSSRGGSEGGYRLVPLAGSHIKGVAKLHVTAFPSFFLSQLGKKFLEAFYGGFLKDESAVTAVAIGPDETVLGAAVGTTEPRGFYSRLFRRNFLRFAWPSLLFSARHPYKLGRIVRSAFFRGGNTLDYPRAALLCSICVDPNWQGHGLGGAVLSEWEARACKAGATVASLTTDAEGNDVVNRFYDHGGWRLTRRFTTTEGRPMNFFLKQLSSPVGGQDVTW